MQLCFQLSKTSTKSTGSKLSIPCPFVNLKCFPQILRTVTIMMRIRGGEVLGIIITLHGTSTLLWKSWKRYTAVESSGFTGRLCSDETLKQNTQAFRAHQGRSLQEALEESNQNSQIIFIAWLLVSNWVDSLVVDPDELLLAVSHLTHRHKSLRV